MAYELIDDPNRCGDKKLINADQKIEMFRIGGGAVPYNEFELHWDQEICKFLALKHIDAADQKLSWDVQIQFISDHDKLQDFKQKIPELVREYTAGSQTLKKYSHGECQFKQFEHGSFIK